MSNPDQTLRCMAQPAQPTSRWGIIPFSYSDLGDLGDAQYIGDETLALPARRYVIERSLLGDFPDGRAEVWIAANSGYVLKMRAEASGKGALQSKPFEGRLVASYHVSQINQPITIEPPKTCTGGLPIMPDPQKMTVTGNLIGYQVTAPLSAVAEFYLSEMGKLGWQIINEPDSSPEAPRLAFEKDDEQITMLFTPSRAGDAIYILIITAAH
jgi:hypothetical protein